MKNSVDTLPRKSPYWYHISKQPDASDEEYQPPLSDKLECIRKFSIHHKIIGQVGFTWYFHDLHLGQELHNKKQFGGYNLCNFKHFTDLCTQT